MVSLSLLGTLSFLIALLVTPLVRSMAIARGWVDEPDHGQTGSRKLHRLPIPRLGGIAICLAYILSFVVLAFSPLNARHIVEQALVIRLLPAGLLIFAVGLADDIFGLKAWTKLLGQLAAGLAVYLAGVSLHGIGGYNLPEWAQLPMTLAWLVLTTNAINLIDGMDGLATGVSLFATLTMLCAALMAGNIPLAMATMPLAGALVGFLRYNFNPATIFLGDCGSLLIGFLLGCFGLIWSQKSATMLGMTAPLMALAIPLLDVGLSIIRRFLRGQPIFGADQGHIHHRLLAKGLTVRKSVMLMYGASMIFAILSLLATSTHSFSGAVLVIFCAVTWIGVQGLGYVELNMAGRLLVGGGFRRVLVGQLALRSYEESIREATSAGEAWGAVTETALQLGFHHVSMEINGKRWETRLKDEVSGTEWTVELPLRKGDRLWLKRPFDSSVHQSALSPFFDTVRKTLVERSETWNSSPVESRPVQRLEDLHRAAQV